MWEERFRAPRMTLPQWALHAPQRCVLKSSESGTWEVYAWDAAAGTRRQVTSRPHGTYLTAVDPSGAEIWWFADQDGDEFGIWMTEPFDGSGPPVPAAPELAPGYPAGLGFGPAGMALAGRVDDAGTQLWLIDRKGDRQQSDRKGDQQQSHRKGDQQQSDRRGEGTATLVYFSREDAAAGAISPDGRLLAFSHSEHGDSRHPAVRVLRLDGSTLADLWDGPGKGLAVEGFSPVDNRLLVGHERQGRPSVLIWDPDTGVTDELGLDLPGEVDASWYPDGRALLLSHQVRARTELYRYDLTARRLQRLDTPPGVIAAATARPDGAVWLSFSSGVQPPQVLDLDGTVVVAPAGPTPPPGAGFVDVDVPGPGGTIHALLARPGRQPPYPAVFLLHGGPEAHDQDSYAPDVSALVDAGYAVVCVNYRGSTGYGTAWRDALEAAPGNTELEDVAAVRAALVANGGVDGQRTALAGASWGGYLTLLGLGIQPELWAAGSAAVPVADYVAAYEDEMEALRAFDRALFGGSPAEVPDAYRKANPITYAEGVRAPVLILAGDNDPRCPIRQVERYVEQLRGIGRTVEIYRFDAGHGSLVLEERVRQMRAELDFLARQMPPD